MDSAVLDRMNELVEIPLPGHPERVQMLQQYLYSHVFSATENDKDRVVAGEDLIATIVNPEKGLASIASDMATMTEGMSGREIEKMCQNVYVSLFA